MKPCENCGLTEGVLPVRNLPLSGRVGHVRLIRMAFYCESCLAAESERVTAGMDKMIADLQKKHQENKNGNEEQSGSSK